MLEEYIWVHKLFWYRQNLALCLMNPKTERYEEAIEQMKLAMKIHTELLRRQNSPRADTSWKALPTLYAHYTEARILGNLLDEETKNVLEKVIEVYEDSSFPKDAWDGLHLVLARINLALVLRALGVEPEKEELLVQQSMTYIRKHPEDKYRLKRFLQLPYQSSHPVSIALGESWIASDESDSKEERRRFRACDHCKLGEPVATLSRCRGCQEAMYCSKTCQRAGWPGHRSGCRASSERILKVKALRDSGQISDRSSVHLFALINWDNKPYYTNIEAPVHALGLQYDPTRAETHVIFRIVHYVEDASALDAGDRFYVEQVGVFRVQDVLADIMVFGNERNLEEARQSFEDAAPLSDREKGYFYLRTWTLISTDGNLIPFLCRTGFGPTGSTLPPRMGEGVRMPISELPPVSRVIAEAEIKRRMGATDDGSPSTSEELQLWREHLDDPRHPMRQLRPNLPPYAKVPDALVIYTTWYLRVPNLFKFCIHAEPSDMPEEYLEELIWVNNLCIKLYEVTTPKMRCDYEAFNRVEHEGDSMGRRVRYREHLAWCLMSPTMERFEEAVEQLKIGVAEYAVAVRMLNLPVADTPWKSHPQVYAAYAEARVLANHLDMVTKEMLEHVLDAAQDPLTRTIRELAWHVVLARANLALVLHVLGIEPDREKQLTQLATSYIRRRPELKKHIGRFLRCHDSHPVLLELGEDWSVTDNIKQIMTMKDHMPAGMAKRMEEFFTWLSSPYYANEEALIHALNLQHDLHRARTHIVFRLIRCVKTRSRDIRDWFRVEQCSVFKIADVYPEIKDCQNLKTDEEVQEYFEDIFAIRDGQRKDVVDVLHLTSFIAGTATGKLGCMLFNVKEERIRRMPYDPAWRQKANHSGRPPAAFVLRAGVQDAEFDYQDNMTRLASYINALQLA
ncbi:hypothetical protein EIP91_002734 [Steccherinum ochraceum]|uniref:MYND-type domain-containing protein n=1 Tax=Steccherinum ochraceum TaxID=92696 RepID=A0A4R0RBK5_9APHY|nr:hypothetical protein EIP91_002734 [Steccherinum ochraceum]